MTAPSTKNGKQLKLLSIYDHFEKWSESFDFACNKGCATCCTQSVTMTTLEGELIYQYLTDNKPELISLLESLPENLPTPSITTNQLARACLQKKDIDEENTHWNLAPCLFLQNDHCAIYPVRSFMCRSFGSQIKCCESGSAEIDQLFLTLNIIIMQCIEHLDQGRPWGNLITILRSLSPVGDHTKKQTLLAEPIPGFHILPEEADHLHQQIKTLLSIIKGDKVQNP